MRKFKFLLLFLVMIVFSSTFVISQTLSISLNSSFGIDSFIQQDKATTNYGLENYIGVDSESGKIERGLIFFNLSLIPANSIIYNATLILNLTSGSGASFNVSVKRLTSFWEEGGVTWNRLNSSTNWISAGGDYSQINYSIVEINNTLGLKYFNLTNLVREYTNNTYENHGFIVSPNVAQGGNNEKRFGSIESLTSTPVLIIDYVSDLTAPNLTINSPENKSYNNSSILINISYSDNSGVSSAWFYNGTGNETYSSPILRTFGQGNNNLIFYVNDTLGNLNSTAVGFYVDSVNPSISITSPSNNQNFTSSSVTISFIASDTNLQSCKYSLNGASNVSVTCGNSFVVNGSQGSNSIVIYANDSLGNINSSSVSFYVDSISPTLSITSPSNNQNFTSTSVTVSFIASDNNLQSCKYSLNGASNVSVICGNSFIVNATQGNNNVVIYANDSLGNINSSSVSFYVDSVNPSIIIYSPQNITYGSNSLYVNFSVQDQSSISSCRIYLDSILISSNCLTFTSSVSDGSHTLEIYANDSFGNNANNNVSFFSDLSPPKYSNLLSNIPGVYNNSISYFNISWTDSSIDSVLFESNFSGISKNYSMTSLGNGKYSFFGFMPAGTYYWRSYANDSLGNINVSLINEFTINKSNEGARLYLNGNQSEINVTYGDGINSSFYSVNNLGNLYFNGLGISNNQNLFLSSGIYNYTLIFEGNQNYSYKSITYYAYVNKASPTIKLLLNGFSSNIGVGVFSLVNITAYSQSPAGIEISLYENENIVSYGNLVEEIINYSTPGTYYWKVNISETQNYTYGELTREINIYDANYPSYSDIKTSSGNQVTYLSNRNYQFNISWTDDIGIDDVILQFNNVNYSYSSGNISKNGDEYYILFNDLPVGTYPYLWIANDSSSNKVNSPNEELIISKANAALVITVAPGSTINYGELMSVNCIANNIESVRAAILERNFESITNPDNSVLGAGIYNYICDSPSTQNYTDPTPASAQLNINQADPQIEFTLNNLSEDINLPYGGGIVNISANLNLLYGIDANLTLYINNNLTYSSNNELEYNFTFNSGVNELRVHYTGNENYSSYNITRYVTVQNPIQPPSTGGGSSGGGGGGSLGSGGLIVKNKTISLEFQSLGDIIISPGESKILELNVKNNGETFLNKCKLKSSQGYETWFKSDTNKNINPGELTEYIFEIKVPLEANRTDDPKLILECIEREFEVPIKTIILNSGMDIEIDNLELLSEEELLINYTVIGNADFEESIIFKVYDNEDTLLSEKKENVKISSGKIKYDSILDVSKADKGLLKVEISKLSGAIIVDEFFVYDSKQPITGFALLDKVGGNSFYVVFILFFFLIIGFLIVKRMHSVKSIKKWENNHDKKVFENKGKKEEFIEIKAEKEIPKNNEADKKENIPKKVKWSHLIEYNKNLEAQKQKNTKLQDEIKKDSFKFETYGGKNNSDWKTY